MAYPQSSLPASFWFGLPVGSTGDRVEVRKRNSFFCFLPEATWVSQHSQVPVVVVAVTGQLLAWATVARYDSSQPGQAPAMWTGRPAERGLQTLRCSQRRPLWCFQKQQQWQDYQNKVSRVQGIPFPLLLQPQGLECLLTITNLWVIAPSMFFPQAIQHICKEFLAFYTL